MHFYTYIFSSVCVNPACSKGNWVMLSGDGILSRNVLLFREQKHLEGTKNIWPKVTSSVICYAAEDSADCTRH